MKLTYTMQGDYLLPNLEVPEAPKVGKYGMLRRSFLRSHRKALYTGMMLADKLNAHLEEVDRQANEMLEKGKVIERKPKSGGASAASPAFVRLQDTAKALDALIAASRGRPNKDLADLANQINQIMEKWKL